MTQERDKQAESTDSSTPAATTMELEMRMLRRTVIDMNKTMEDMRANQEHTAKLLHDKTASMRPPQEAAQSVKSPERRYEPETPAQERARKGKMPQGQAYIVEAPQGHAQTERPAQGLRTEIPTRGRYSDEVKAKEELMGEIIGHC